MFSIPVTWCDGRPATWALKCLGPCRRPRISQGFDEESVKAARFSVAVELEVIEGWKKTSPGLEGSLKRVFARLYLMSSEVRSSDSLRELGERL